MVDPVVRRVSYPLACVDVLGRALDRAGSGSNGNPARCACKQRSDAGQTRRTRRGHRQATMAARMGNPALYSGLRSAESAAQPFRTPVESRFRFAKDQRRYLVTRALVRTVLSRYADVRPQDWDFSAGPRGRPVISAPRAAPALEFNISHSADLVLLGVTAGRTLGIDTESVATREADIDGLDRYFAPEESAALLALEPGDRRRRIFEPLDPEGVVHQGAGAGSGDRVGRVSLRAGGRARTHAAHAARARRLARPLAAVAARPALRLSRGSLRGSRRGCAAAHHPARNRTARVTRRPSPSRRRAARAERASRIKAPGGCERPRPALICRSAA